MKSIIIYISAIENICFNLNVFLLFFVKSALKPHFIHYFSPSFPTIKKVSCFILLFSFAWSFHNNVYELDYKTAVYQKIKIYHFSWLLLFFCYSSWNSYGKKGLALATDSFFVSPFPCISDCFFFLFYFRHTPNLEAVPFACASLFWHLEFPP